MAASNGDDQTAGSGLRTVSSLGGLVNFGLSRFRQARSIAPVAQRKLLIVGIGLALATLSRLAIGVTSARALSGSAAGRYLTILSIVVITGIVLRFGLDTNSVRLISRSRLGAERSRIISLSAMMLTGISIAILLFGLLGGTRLLYNDLLHFHLTQVGLLAISVWTVGEVCRLVMSESLRGLGYIGDATFLGDPGRYSCLALLLGFLWSMHQSTITSFLVASAGSSIAFMLLAIADVLLRKPPHSDRSSMSLRGMLGGSMPIYLSLVAGFITSQGDTIIVGVLLPHLTAAIYQNSSRISLRILLPLIVVNLASSPTIAHGLHHGQKRLLEAKVRVLATMASLIAAASYLIMVVFIRPFVHFVYPPKYSEVSVIVLILAAGPMISTFAGPNGLSLNMGGRARDTATAMGIVGTVQVVLMVLVARSWGIIAVACISSLGTIVLNFSLSWLTRKRLQFPTEAYLTPKRCLAAIRSFS